MFVVLAAVVAVAISAPQNKPTEPIPIVSQTQDGPNPDGSYSYSYETGNGIKANEEGHLNNPGSNNEAMQVKGGYSYTDPDGKLVSVTYTADENGFRPQGAHLPTPPPIPKAILDWIKKYAQQ